MTAIHWLALTAVLAIIIAALAVLWAGCVLSGRHADAETTIDEEGAPR